MRIAHRTWQRAVLSIATCGCLTVAALAGTGCTKGDVVAPAPSASAPPPTDSIELSTSQLGAIKLATLSTQSFKVQRSAVGSIDFNENTAVQVYPPYAGRIIQTYADIGDGVTRGKTLYTIDSPDLLQAESTLITDAGLADLTAAALSRAKDLYEHEGMAQKDYQQAVSDQMSAEAALKSAKDAVRIFGKGDAQIQAMIAKRKVDASLIVQSPMTGRIATRAAQPGLYVQPGTPPAPFEVADLSTIWMMASVAERDIAQLKVGQSVVVAVNALDKQQFNGVVKAIGETVDPNTHTALVRSEVRDPEHRLRPGMMATFVIETAAPSDSVAIPVNGVVREGDGTMSVWVTTDRQKFTRRIVSIGLQQEGFDQILAGVQAGELAVIDGAILLSNILSGAGGGD